MTLLCTALVLMTLPAASAPERSVLEARPQTPLASAVEEALRPSGIRQGGTTPRAAVLTDDNVLGELFVGTPQVILAIEGAIQAARDEVLLQVYQWVDEDEASARIRDAIDRRLARANEAGESFRIGLVVGNAVACEHPLTIDKTINTLSRHAAQNANLRIELLAYDGTLFDILHSKTVVIDGRWGIVSTANFYTHGGVENDSFNMAAAVCGPVVAGLMQDWHHARHHARGLWQKGLDKTFYLPSEDADWAARHDRSQTELQPEDLWAFTHAIGPLQASVLSRPARNIFLHGGDHNPQAQGLLALFREARRSITAINPALNVSSYKDALMDAIVERNVEVHLLLSFHMNRRRQHFLMGGDNSDTALDLYTRLLERGGERAADRLRLYFGTGEDGALAPSSHPGNIHAKVASIDGDAFVIGSTNWDWPSYNSAREISVVLFGKGVGVRFERDIFDKRLEAARAIQAHDLPAGAQHPSSAAFRYLKRREERR